jgi:hypothetical protein
MTEQQIQKAIFAHLKQRAVPNAFFWHPFSGGFRKPKEAAIYKGLGAIAGLPDVIIVKDGRIFAIELKTHAGCPSGGDVSTGVASTTGTSRNGTTVKTPCSSPPSSAQDFGGTGRWMCSTAEAISRRDQPGAGAGMRDGPGSFRRSFAGRARGGYLAWPARKPPWPTS